jgi:uncharacterized membrane protein
MASDAIPPLPEPQAKPSRFRSFKRPKLRTSLVTGIVVAAPIGLSIFLIWSFVAFVDDQVRPVVLGVTPNSWHKLIDEYAAIPGLGLILLLVALTLVGMLTANMVGRTVVGWGDSIARRTPILGTIYKTLKQIIETIIAQTEPAFKQVCLIEYPSKGTWRLAFVIGSAKGEIQAKFDEDMMTIFMPSTPNPMTGYLMFMPKKTIRLLEMSIEDGIKMLVSAGIVTPDRLPTGGLAPGPSRTSSILSRLTRRRREPAA